MNFLDKMSFCVERNKKLLAGLFSLHYSQNNCRNLYFHLELNDKEG